MKTLILVRHAKSSWDNINLTDIKRPLNQRGKRDAPFMGELLKDKSIMPDLIISSPAERALSTAKILAEKIQYPENKIEINKRIYRVVFRDLYNEVKNFYNSFSKIMMVGHNPELTDFLSSVTNTYVEDIPTAGICTIELNISGWIDICEGCGKLLSLEYPRKYC